MNQNLNNQTPLNFPVLTSTISDVDRIIIKLSKDIEYLKDKVVELESEKLAKHFHMSPEEAKEQFMVPPPSKSSYARGYRPILESEIRASLEHSDCMAECARFLRITGKTFKKYAKRYGLFKPNPYGSRGKRKPNGANTGKYPLDKILRGEIIFPDPWKLKNKLLLSKIKQKSCERCGWKDSRPDGLCPLVINFVDGDQTNQKLENIKIYCYNCTFVLRGYIRRGVVIFDDVRIN